MLNLLLKAWSMHKIIDLSRGYRGRMVVEFTAIYTISSYHYKNRTPFMARCTQYNIIKFVSDWRQVGGALRALWFTSPIKLTATI